MRVLIIGTGIAGLTAAILAEKKGYLVTLITKTGDPFESTSRYAQGGIVYRGEGDSSELLYHDIKAAGTNIINPKAVKIISEEGPGILKEILIDLIKVPFSKNKNKYLFTGEAAHSVKRILYIGDNSGFAIIKSLFDYLKNKTSINIITDSMAVDILNMPHHSNSPQAIYRKNYCMGAHILNTQTGQIKKFFADKVILATGGIGQVYKHTSNPKSSTGDGIALAYRAGAKIVNMEYTQFHPTTLAIKEAKNFLISETLRGEGGILLNHRGEDFMKRYDKRGSLAPRDIVSRAILDEMEKEGKDYVYLSLGDFPSEKIKIRFNNIYKKCLQYKVDITKEPIPVVPAFHFSCGGVLTDMEGLTTLPNLYAIGETACTGIHGANRIASTSLLEGIVFAQRTINGLKINKYNRENFEDEILDWNVPVSSEMIDPVLINQDWTTLKSIMWNYVGIIRKTKRMARAINDLYEMKNGVDDFYRNVKLNKDLLELRNSIQTGIIIANSAIKNLESLGCHYRLD